jgi:hypothetical protein
VRLIECRRIRLPLRAKKARRVSEQAQGRNGRPKARRVSRLREFEQFSSAASDTFVRLPPGAASAACWSAKKIALTLQNKIEKFTSNGGSSEFCRFF